MQAVTSVEENNDTMYKVKGMMVYKRVIPMGQSVRKKTVKNVRYARYI